MRRGRKRRSTPVTRAISWTMLLGLFFVVLQVNAVMVANTWSDHQTRSDLAFSLTSAGIVSIQPHPGNINSSN
jgi:hypothetical protein